MRSAWHEYFMKMAEVASERATCKRRSVGSVIVKDKRIIATGYNGAPMGLKHCLEIGCIRDEMNIPSGERVEHCSAVHSEMNAIIQAAYSGVSTKGATIYITCPPCHMCSKMIINAGIECVVFKGQYNDTVGVLKLQEARIKVKHIE